MRVQARAVRRGELQARRGIDHHRKERDEKGDGELRLNAQPKPYQDDGRNGDLRH